MPYLVMCVIVVFIYSVEQVVVMEIGLMLFVSGRCRYLVLFLVSHVYSSHGDMLDDACE